MRASLLLAAAALTGCAELPEPAPSPRAQIELQRELAGRVPGRPQACLPYYRSGNMIGIDRNTLLFRDGNRVYLNRLRGGCARMIGGSYSLVTRSLGGVGLCSGDIAQLVDLSTGTIAGSCVMGDFVPYVPANQRP